MRDTLKSSIIRTEMTNEGCVAVDIAWCADLFCNPADRDLFAVEFAMSIFKIMHSSIASESTNAVRASGVASLRRSKLMTSPCVADNHFLDPNDQIQGIQAIESTIEIHEQSSECVMPLSIGGIFPYRSRGICYRGRHAAQGDGLQSDPTRRHQWIQPAGLYRPSNLDRARTQS